MWFFLASLAMLFFTSMFGYLYIRFNAAQWPPAGSPGMPAGLWISTAVLILASVFVHRAYRSVRKDDQRGLRRNLVWTFAFGTLFLGLQIVNYVGLAAMNLTAKTDLYGFTFYMLTGLHALHVVGGLIQLGIVTKRATTGRYTASSCVGIEYTTMYWHFLDAIWVVLFAVLLIGS